MSIDIFTKQPGDTVDIDVDLSLWLPSSDSITTATVVADAGITLGATAINNTLKTVKQWVSGGTTGNRYKVTLTIASAEGRVKESEFYIKVKEI